MRYLGISIAWVLRARTPEFESSDSPFWATQFQEKINKKRRRHPVGISRKHTHCARGAEENKKKATYIWQITNQV
jgi:hypothetical protein